MEKGIQPLDAILTELNLKSHDLVEVSSLQLTHRMVTRGRKGRRLTRNTQTKILTALNDVQSAKVYRLEELFDYRPVK